MPPTRAHQPTAPGFGKHFTSPQKVRDKKKTTTRVTVPGQAARQQKALAKLKALQFPIERPEDTTPTHEEIEEHPLYDSCMDQQPDVQMPSVEPPDHSSDDFLTTSQRRTIPDATASRLYDTWKTLLPSLVPPFLEYLTVSNACVLTPTGDIRSTCNTTTCPLKTAEITALFFDHFRSISVTTCLCQNIPSALIRHGLFPAAPSQPRVAISIDLLDFYRALFERSCDAVNAVVSALHSFYKQRGFDVLDKKGEPVRDPFRRSFGYAIQWHDALRVLVEKAVSDALETSYKCIQASEAPQVSETSEEESPPPTAVPPLDSATSVEPPPSERQPDLTRGRCARILQQRCPACFSGTLYGRSFNAGADIHISTDGNFHHRHRKSAGDSPSFHDPAYILPKAQVDAVGRRLEQSRSARPRTFVPKVPDEAVDECEKAHAATRGSNDTRTSDQFDDTGLMTIVCRHDIPLFFANIDTPGEQQKYSVALIEHVFSLIPPEATVACLYDVACVLDRSANLYDIFSPEISGRLMLATTAMHAYGHQWSCQLVYNPRLRIGLGLTDGEGVERLWSRLRKLIGITRSSGRSRRIWLIDRQASFIACELRDDLGDWIRRRLRLGLKTQYDKAQGTLEKCGIPVSELRHQWKLQQECQLSLRAHAPTRFKKELDSLLTLQSDLDTVDRTLQTSRATLTKSAHGQETQDLLASLGRTHDRLKDKVDALYASLNIPDAFPELHGIDFDFIQILLMARDLKINIRKRAIGSFFEWDKLDQAAGGRQEALGTKLHQHTRKAIARRKPALVSALRKFNKYCETLETLYNPAWSIPLPQPLPTDLSELRSCAHLMEDIWTTPSTGDIPRWLEDLDVREGIRAMLRIDRCLEEECRLAMEADNLCRWLAEEVGTVELAIQTPSFKHLRLLLQQRRSCLLRLKTTWSNPLVTTARFEKSINAELEVAWSLVTGTNWCQVISPEPNDQLEVGHDPPEDVNRDGPEPLNSDELIVADILEAEPDDSPQMWIDTDVDMQDSDVGIIWKPLEDLRIDYELLNIISNTTFVESDIPDDSPRTFHRKHGLPSVHFEVRDLAILKSGTARLNDICINGGAALLQDHFAPPNDTHRCAILSTFDLVRVRYRASDEDLWRNIHKTKYWDKCIWILPIHRRTTEHWVIGIVSLKDHRILLFDSLAAERPWHRDVKDIIRLVARMIHLANRHGKTLHITSEGWTALPLSVRILQTNAHDCGIWVLSCVAAVLRGYHLANLTEIDLRYVRRFIYDLALALPSSQVL